METDDQMEILWNLLGLIGYQNSGRSAGSKADLSEILSRASESLRGIGWTTGVTSYLSA
ncbi:hypothetical protein [Sporomusa sp.]|uniref:hypothetical protein n=1 Tax=Sporomusa sp. TaxID=2078658 RepID=UPI002BCC5762|nr:hypothetical protein [Sporomusa sp.]HWR45077.1 hypothetical protein [Sporomusa sp.]